MEGLACGLLLREEVMAQILVSYFMNSRRSTPYGLRIWDDGRIESFDTSHETVDARGKIKTEAVTPGWYPLGEMSIDQLDEVRKAVDAVNFAAMPSVIKTEDTLHADPTVSEWVAKTPQGQVNVKVPQWAPLPPGAEPLAKLVTIITNIVSEGADDDDDDEE